MNNEQNKFINPQMNNEFETNNLQPNLNVIPNFNNQQPVEPEDTLVIKQNNKFINNDIDTTSTSLNNLNIDGAYNNMPKVDYSQEPKVKENMQKKNTVTITSEGKVFLIIIAVLLIFVIVLPMVFDFITNISYK